MVFNFLRGDYDWFNKRINSKVEYFSKEKKWWDKSVLSLEEYKYTYNNDRWWDDNILSLEEYYEIERIVKKNKIFKMLLPVYLPKEW